MKQDRFLMIILGVIGILVVLSIILFFIRQEPQAYGRDDSPEGVIRNYILALQKEDYKRAYEYLQDANGKPSLTEFQQNFLNSKEEVFRAAVQLGETSFIDSDAHIPLSIIHSSNDPFDRTWDENSTALLIQQNGEWRIVNLPYPFWGWDWYSSR